jgi:thiamine kinase-like enzyme
MVIVDWEYSGMNDPMWDLGDLSVEAGFGPEQDAALLHAYFDGPPPQAARGRMILYKAMCDLLWTLWGVIQHANKNPVDDFWAYAVNRFNRCRSLMATSEFSTALQAVTDG